MSAATIAWMTDHNPA